MEPPKCPFCKPFADDIVTKNELCYARWDRFPASKGHLLVLPYRHTPNLFTLPANEWLALFSLIDECRVIIEENFHPHRVQHRVQYRRSGGADRDALPHDTLVL